MNDNQIIEKLQGEIEELQMQLAKQVIRDNCPYAYHTFKDHRSLCEEDTCECSRCKIDFFNHYREEVKAEIRNKVAEMRKAKEGKGVISNPKEIYIAMMCWESYNGESFLDYYVGSNIEGPRFINWLYSKDYLTCSKFGEYLKAKFGRYGTFEHPSVQDILCGDKLYSIIYVDYEANSNLSESDKIRLDELRNCKCLQLLAEYISVLESKYDLFNTFVFEGRGWACTCTSESTSLEVYKQGMKQEILKWRDNEWDDFDIIKNITIESISDTRKEE